MRFRKLRIAWSAACGITCLLLIVLWVRSYWWAEVLEYPHGAVGATFVVSAHGVLIVSIDGNYPNVSVEPIVWRDPIADWEFSMGGLPEHFQMKTKSKMILFGLPHMVLVLIAGAFGALPWIRWRFSLRTLLIGVTLVAVVLGILAISN